MKLALLTLVLAGCTNHYDVTDHRPVAEPCAASSGDSMGSDECLTDGDCGAAMACACAGTTFEYAHGTRNLCVPAGCHIDADCGAGGSCSPSVGDCGTFYGTQLYACHSSDDECGSDADCSDGYCEFNPAVSHWTCGNQFCAG
jgi:hypothetical protein